MNRSLPLSLLALAATTALQHQDEGFSHPVVSTPHNDIASTVPPSPECWMGAMTAMQQLPHDAASSFDGNSPPQHSLGSLVCTNMSHDHKKALALELARCQMEDVGRSLFEQDSTSVDQCSRPLTSTAVLHSCLGKMTDQGMHAYSLFFTHVHQSCTRLTQEHLMQASQVATEQLHTIMAQQNQVWADRDAQHEEMLSNLWNKAEEREREMMELTKNVEATAEKIKPLLGIESLVSMATNGFTWLTSLLFFLGLLNGLWLLSLSPRHDYTRRIMFRMACIEALLEFAMHWMVTQGLLADEERVQGIDVLRSWTMTLECILYVFGLILSVFKRPKKKHDDTPAMNNEAIVEMMQLMTNAERMRKETISPREQARVGEVVMPRMPSPAAQVTNEASESSPSGTPLVSVPPMYQELARPTVHLAPNTNGNPTIEAIQQEYAAAYYDSLRRVLAQQQVFASEPLSVRVSPEQQLDDSIQILEEQAASSLDSKDPKKRLLKDDDDDDGETEEPQRKRARNL